MQAYIFEFTWNRTLLDIPFLSIYFQTDIGKKYDWGLPETLSTTDKLKIASKLGREIEAESLAKKVAEEVQGRFSSKWEVKVPSQDSKPPWKNPPPEKEISKHLKLGITIKGIEEWLEYMVDNLVTTDDRSVDESPLMRAVAQNNKQKKRGGENPPDKCFNGYVNQQYIIDFCQKNDPGKSYCEILRDGGTKLSSEEVGTATIFVSWWLGSSVESLLEALKEFCESYNLDPSTKFWICVSIEYDSNDAA